MFSKTAQGGFKKLADSKWFIPNRINAEIWPVRLILNTQSKLITVSVCFRQSVKKSPSKFLADIDDFLGALFLLLSATYTGKYKELEKLFNITYFVCTIFLMKLNLIEFN